MLFYIHHINIIFLNNPSHLKYLSTPLHINTISEFKLCRHSFAIGFIFFKGVFNLPIDICDRVAKRDKRTQPQIKG